MLGTVETSPDSEQAWWYPPAGGVRSTTGDVLPASTKKPPLSGLYRTPSAKRCGRAWKHSKPCR